MASDLVLITGATGHLGFRTLVDLLKAGYRVRAAVRSTTAPKVTKIKASPEILALGLSPDTLTFVTVPDFLAPGAFDTATKDVKYVVHLASPIPGAAKDSDDLEVTFVHPAVRGTVSVLESANKSPSIEKVVVTSSVVAVLPPTSLAGENVGAHFDVTNRVTFQHGPYPDQGVAYVMSKVAALNEGETWYNKNKPAFSLVHVMPGIVLGRDALVDETAELKTNGTNAWLLANLTGADDARFGGVVHVNEHMLRRCGRRSRVCKLLAILLTSLGPMSRVL
jgi:nucleoside-diphosphate-sugar epimerase